MSQQYGNSLTPPIYIDTRQHSEAGKYVSLDFWDELRPQKDFCHFILVCIIKWSWLHNSTALSGYTGINGDEFSNVIWVLLAKL